MRLTDIMDSHKFGNMFGPMGELSSAGLILVNMACHHMWVILESVKKLNVNEANIINIHTF